MEPGNISSRECLDWARSFDNIINDHKGREIFRRFMTQECSPKFEFWLACETLKEYDPMQKEKVARVVTSIYQKYIKGRMLQLPEVMKQQLLLQLRKGKAQGGHSILVFCDAQNYVEESLRRNEYPLFLNSDVFIEYLQKGNEFDQYTQKYASQLDDVKALREKFNVSFGNLSSLPESDFEDSDSSFVGQRSYRDLSFVQQISVKRSEIDRLRLNQSLNSSYLQHVSFTTNTEKPSYTNTDDSLSHNEDSGGETSSINGRKRSKILSTNCEMPDVVIPRTSLPMPPNRDLARDDPYRFAGALTGKLTELLQNQQNLEVIQNLTIEDADKAHSPQPNALDAAEMTSTEDEVPEHIKNLIMDPALHEFDDEHVEENCADILEDHITAWDPPHTVTHGETGQGRAIGSKGNAWYPPHTVPRRETTTGRHITPGLDLSSAGSVWAQQPDAVLSSEHTSWQKGHEGTHRSRQYSPAVRWNGTGYSQQTGGYSHNTGGYNQKTGGYNRNTGGYNQNNGGYHQNSSGYNHNTGGYNHTTGAFNQNLRGYNQNTGGFNHNTGGYSTYGWHMYQIPDAQFSSQKGKSSQQYPLSAAPQHNRLQNSGVYANSNNHNGQAKSLGDHPAYWSNTGQQQTMTGYQSNQVQQQPVGYTGAIGYKDAVQVKNSSYPSVYSTIDAPLSNAGYPHVHHSFEDAPDTVDRSRHITTPYNSPYAIGPGPVSRSTSSLPAYSAKKRSLWNSLDTSHNSSSTSQSSSDLQRRSSTSSDNPHTPRSGSNTSDVWQNDSDTLQNCSSTSTSSDTYQNSCNTSWKSCNSVENCGVMVPSVQSRQSTVVKSASVPLLTGRSNNHYHGRDVARTLEQLEGNKEISSTVLKENKVLMNRQLAQSNHLTLSRNHMTLAGNPTHMSANHMTLSQLPNVPKSDKLGTLDQDNTQIEKNLKQPVTSSQVTISEGSQLAVSPRTMDRIVMPPPMYIPIKPVTVHAADTVVVGYYLFDEKIPYKTKMAGPNPTLGQFKKLVGKKGQYRYFFKKHSDEFDCGVVYEELCDDQMVLPRCDGKIIGKIEHMD